MDPQEFLDLASHLFPGQRELWGVSLVGRVHVGAVGGAVDEDGGGRGAVIVNIKLSQASSTLFESIV